MRLRSMVYLPGAILVITGIVFYLHVDWESAHAPLPLVLPLSLAPGTVETRPMRIDIDRDYDIVIDFDETRLRNERMNVDIAWQLSENGRVLSEGTSADKPVEDWAGTVERTIGTFRGQAAHVYQLTLRINPDTTRLDDANPVLRVQIPRGLWEDYLAGVAIRKLESTALGMLGLIVLGGAWLSTRSRKAMVR